MWTYIFYLHSVLYVLHAQGYYDYNYENNDVLYEQLKCPEHWVQLQQSCYRFIKSPARPYNEARKICQSFVPDAGGTDLVSVNNFDEHGFLIYQLTWQDPQHRRWYTGIHQLGLNNWQNADGSPLINMENAFLPDHDSYGKDYLVYNFSTDLMRWGFKAVWGEEPLLYICEGNIVPLQRLVSDDRTYKYGIDIDNPEFIPQGPYFIKQPVDMTFDLSKRKVYNDIAISCLAGGFPTPTYQWFREDYEDDRLVAREIDPLSDRRFTISGGTLIINNPEQKRDRATYHCKASNKYGTIISESAELNFGFILEFVLRRSPESGDQNWGKAIFCDPPTHFPGVKYYWSRDWFPNFVEEDKRVFVSHDGALYFSALETIDRGNYSCSVQSEVSDTGRNGPFFPLRVNPHSNYQQLKFPNNFPKAFPEAPIAGNDVRLECMAFGYPIPSYNWTKKGGVLPRHSYLTSYNRVLNIPNVKIEDQGEYACRIYNDRSAIENSVILNIQAEPNFTIPLTDKHVDSRGELVWTCEAFGIPDVNYTWWRNGRQLVMGYLDPEDRGRIRVQDNILTVHDVDPDRDPGMYQCRASNTLKTRYSSAQLRVLAFKPSFKKRPLESETYAAEYGNVTIVCNPEAAPRPKFVWKKYGHILGSSGRVRILEHGNLVINRVSRDDEGLYTCTATNDLGMDESQGRLVVIPPPRLVEPLRPRIVTSAGRDIFLHCKAVTEEMLDVAYIWTHNGMRIRDYEIKNSNNRLQLEGGYFVIYNATFSDAGDYECIVKSTVGQIASKSTIVVEGPPGPPDSYQGPHEKRLLNNLLTPYNVLERPVANESEPLEVKFGLTLQQIIDVEWNDYNLRWNESEYGGVKDLRITPNKLWKPDVLMYNSADEGFDGTFQTNVVVKHGGSCLYVPPGIFKSTCKIDITWFPFDDQHCDMKFGSWTYDGNQLDLILNSEDGGDLSDFITNGEWYLIGMPGKKNTIVYQCCPEPYVDVTFTIQIRRRTLYYFFNLIVPCVLISSMALLGFTLPPDSGEKLTLGTYFNCIMFMVASSVVLTVVVLNYHHRTADIHEMPQWIKSVFLQWLPWILGMSRPGKKITRKTILMNSRMKELELKERSSKSLLANVLDIDDDFRNVSGGGNSGSVTTSLGAGFMRHPTTIEEAAMPSSGTQRDLQLILRELQFITARMRKADEEAEVISDWKFAAMVVDRFCLIIFTMFTIIATVAVLLSAPHIIVQ